MYGKVSFSRQIILGIILLVIIFGIIEAYANVWWYEFNTCAFENSEIFQELSEKQKNVLCQQNTNLMFMEDRIENYARDTNVIYSINSQGFRGPEFSETKPDGVYRIFVVGGSTTFGTGVYDDQTFPSYLQKLFDQSNFDFNIEVINAGIGTTRGNWCGRRRGRAAVP